VPTTPNGGQAVWEDPAKLLQTLIRFDTTNPPGNEKECVTYIDNLLRLAGFETELFFRHPKRPNLIARLRGDNSKPPLMLYGHADVVTTANQSWKHPPFAGKIVDGYVWGRGALDMKGGIAMMLSAILRAKAENFVPAGDIVLAILCDEENGGDNGAKFMVESHPEQFEEIKYAIGEFGGYSIHMGGHKFYPIQVTQKNTCRLKATIRGPGGHGARLTQGGTMSKLAGFLQKLDENFMPVHITPVMRQMVETAAAAMPFAKSMVLRRVLNPGLTDRILKLSGDNGHNMMPLFHNTVNATVVSGGEKHNVIPSEVVVILDGRLLPGYTPGQMIEELRQIIGYDVELEIIRSDPMSPETDMGLFTLLADILRDLDPEGTSLPMLLPASTDGRHFSKIGVQTYGFTPMLLPPGFNFFETIHAANERIPEVALSFGRDAIYNLIRRY
jgi:acetylornithine deacetylase/succinyl-diaminopimelate desuccinylase-like protein